MECAPYCGLHESNLKAIHDRSCDCGHFEAHQQGFTYVEVTDSSEESNDENEEL